MFGALPTLCSLDSLAFCASHETKVEINNNNYKKMYSCRQ